MMKFIITATEIYSATYEIEAETKEEAVAAWENGDVAPNYFNLDVTNDRRINGDEF